MFCTIFNFQTRSRAADMLLQRWNKKDYGEHRNGQKGMDVPERR